MLAKPKRKTSPSLLKRIRAQPCAIEGCRGKSDAAHIRSKGAGGPDEEWNVIPLCREHHQVQHAHGWQAMWGLYPSVRHALTQLGWIGEYGVFDGKITFKLKRA
jgi:hypothetical protein